MATIVLGETQLLESFEPPGGGDPDIAALYAGRTVSLSPAAPWLGAGPAVHFHAGAARVPPAPPAEAWPAGRPAAPEPTQTYGPYEIAAVERSHTRGWLILGLVALALVGVGAAYLFTRPGPPSAQDIVRDYFTDLSTDDVVSALALVDGGATYADRSAYPFLDPSALAQPADRPTGLTVTGTTHTTTASGAAATEVSVSYLIADTTVHQTIVVAKPDAPDPAASGGAAPPSLALEAPFVHLVVASSAGRAATVNGVAYPGGAGPSGVLALPGAYNGQIDGDTLLAPASAAATYDSSSPGDVRVSITFPSPAAAPGAGEAVQSAVNAALTACAQSQSPVPGDGCPFQYSDTSATMTWSITTFPQISLQIGDDGTASFTDAGHPAVVHYEATTSGFLGFPSTDDGDLTVDVSGTATAADNGTVSVALATS